MLNLNRLHILQEFHRLGTITAVAESMNYSRSAISQQMALLEKEIGVKLFEKSGRNLYFTEQGEVLATETHAIMAAVDHARAAVLDSLSEVSGTLKVTSFQSLLFTLAPTAIARLTEKYPHLQVEISQLEVTAALEELRARRVDVALGEEYPVEVPLVDASIHREVLFEDPMLLVTPASGPYSGLTLSELRDIPIAIDPPDLPAGEWVHRLCRRAGFEPRVTFETSDPMLQAHLVRSGLAVTFSPTLLTPMLAGVHIQPLPGNPTRTLYTAVREGRQGHPAIKAFRRALAHVAKESYLEARLVE